MPGFGPGAILPQQLAGVGSQNSNATPYVEEDKVSKAGRIRDFTFDTVGKVLDLLGKNASPASTSTDPTGISIPAARDQHSPYNPGGQGTLITGLTSQFRNAGPILLIVAAIIAVLILSRR